MIGYHIRRNSFHISVAFFVLVWPLILQAHLINPKNFNAADLKKITDAVAADTTNEPNPDGTKKYNEVSYNCYHFARDLQYNLWKDHKIESIRINMTATIDGIKNKEHNAVRVTIKDKDGKPTDVYIEPQTDKIYTDMENLRQGLDETKNEKIESIKTTENAVLIFVVTTYVDNKNTHLSLDVRKGTKQFTVKVTVIDEQRRRVAGQSVTIAITDANDPKRERTVTVTGITDKNGEVKIEASTSATSVDALAGKKVEIKATIHVLPQAQEGTDSKDPTATKKIDLRVDNLGACLPVEPDGMRPDRPVYVSADGQVAVAEFPFFNYTDSPVEFQPVLECRRNCDGSELIDVLFDPGTVAIAPDDCAIAQAFITNLTAPPGEMIVGHLHGITDEPRLVFIDVYDPASGPPYTPSHTMLESLGLSDIVPPTRLLDTSDCTWASDGSTCEFPGPSQEICGLDNFLLDMEQDATDSTFNHVLPCGEGPAGLTVCASSEPPPPGRYVCLIAHFEDDILQSPFSHHQYAYAFDSDGLAFNNYTSDWPWTKDFFIGTDLWFELIGDPIGWYVQVRDPRQGFDTVPSNAIFVIAGRELLLLVPEAELTSEATFRVTAFGHMGGWLQGPWSGRVQPPVGEGDPLFPIATNLIVVRPPYEASNPNPANFATGVPTDGTNLSWIPGFSAVSRDVHFGDTFPPTFVGSTTGNNFNPGPLEKGTAYYWQIDEIQSDATSHSSPIWRFTTESPGTGMILREVWEGIGGTSVSDLTSNENYPLNPDFVEQLTSFEAPTNTDDNYGSRIHGWLYPETSGDYTFWIASKDNSELWLSTDDDQANAALIAEVPGWTSHQQWDKYPEQKSSPTQLEAGGKYYIEALMKAGEGDDHLSVAWTGPGIGTDPVVIDGAFLSPWIIPVAPPEPIEIDSFSVDLPLISPPDEGLAAGAVLLSDAIFGGERDAVVVWMNLPEPPPDEDFPDDPYFGIMGRRNVAAISEGVTLVVENGMLILTVGSSSLGQAVLSWDGIDGSATNVQANNGLGDFDITDGGAQDGIALEIAGNEQAVKVSVILFSNSEDSSEMTQTIPATSVPIVVDYLFEEFTRNGNGATLMDIEAIVLFIGSGGGVSGPEVIEIDSIRTYSNDSGH